jgi:glycosyltransferase involved in cell wall biosynthesis
LINDLDRCIRHMRTLDVIHWNLHTEGCFAWLHLLPELSKVVTLYDATVVTVPDYHIAQNIRQWTSHFARVRELHSEWLTISQSAHDDLVRVCGLDPKKGRVIYPGHNYDGSDAVAQSTATGPPAQLGFNGSPYILTVGTIEPRKNLLRLLQAFRRISEQSRFADWKLVVVGRAGWKYEEILAELQHTPSAIWAGRLSHDDLAAAYQHASVFAFPSLYEGFGLPVVEAMSFGLPVVTSNVSSLPEVAGPAGVLVDPLDVDALRTALERLLADPQERRQRGEAGREFAKQFHWDRAARQVMDVLANIAARGQTDTLPGPSQNDGATELTSGRRAPLGLS